MESLFLIVVFIKALVFNDFSVFEVWEQFKKSTSDDAGEIQIALLWKIL